MSNLRLATINITARLSIVSEIRGETLSKPEMFYYQIEADMEEANRTPENFHKFMEDALHNAYANHFLEKLRTDSRLRTRIGGTRWKTHLHEYSYKAVEATV